MIAAVDIGNSLIEIGVFEEDTLLFTASLSNQSSRTAMDWAILFKQVFELNGIDAKSVTGGIIDSVVPAQTKNASDALRQVCGIRPYVVGPGLKSGLKIGIDDPKQLGADMVAAAVGALELYKPPLVVINMVTAVVFSVIDAEGVYRGGIIMPGPRLSYNALTKATAQLPSIAFRKPRKIIGTNTIDAMESGAVNGQAAMIDGLLDRVAEEMAAPDGSPSDLTVIATGPDAELVIPYCRHKISFEPALVMAGLKKLYERNSR